MSQLEIKELDLSEVSRWNAPEVSRWNAYVLAHPKATFFHRAEWKQAIEGVYGHDCHYLYAEEDGRILGVLPLVRIKSRLFGHSLTSVAFCVYGGPVFDNERAQNALNERAVALGAELGVDHIEYRSLERTVPDWACKEDTHATFIKQIETDPEAILLAIPRKQRAVVRKSLKAGLESRLDENVDSFFNLYATSVRNLGTPVFPKKWFAALKDIFAGDCDILTINAQGRPVSSVMSFYFRGSVLPYYAGGTLGARRLGSNDFMYYDLMCRAADRGYTMFDFGRSKVGSGAFSFKKNFGFTPSPLYYETYLMRGDTLPDVSPNNPRYRLMIAAWSRLPLWAANRLGPLLARSLG